MTPTTDRTRDEALMRRRAVLQARSRILRNRIVGELAGVRQPLSILDRAESLVRRLLARPAWLGLLAALGFALKPRRALSWTARAWGAWRLWRSLRDGGRA